MEQRWSSLLLFLLLFYNNPFFPLTLTSACLLGGVTDATLQSIFLFSLLLFWLCALHGLRQTRRPLVTFYLPKVSNVIVRMGWREGKVDFYILRGFIMLSMSITQK